MLKRSNSFIIIPEGRPSETGSDFAVEETIISGCGHPETSHQTGLRQKDSASTGNRVREPQHRHGGRSGRGVLLRHLREQVRRRRHDQVLWDLPKLVPPKMSPARSEANR